MHGRSGHGSWCGGQHRSSLVLESVFVSLLEEETWLVERLRLTFGLRVSCHAPPLTPLTPPPPPPPHPPLPFLASKGLSRQLYHMASLQAQLRLPGPDWMLLECDAVTVGIILVCQVVVEIAVMNTTGARYSRPDSLILTLGRLRQGCLKNLRHVSAYTPQFTAVSSLCDLA